MTAQIVNIAPEIEAAIHAGKLTKIEITEACMKLHDGVFTLNAKDLLPPKEVSAERTDKPQTNAERQRAWVKRKRKPGLLKIGFTKAFLR